VGIGHAIELAHTASPSIKPEPITGRALPLDHAHVIAAKVSLTFALGAAEGA
jgi:hypothetical protein